MSQHAASTIEALKAAHIQSKIKHHLIPLHWVDLKRTQKVKRKTKQNASTNQLLSIKSTRLLSVLLSPAIIRPTHALI